MRGVERRAAVFAELQAGDAGSGDEAVESALYLFREQADRLPMNEWPSCFWALLLVQPRLQGHAGVAIPLQASDRLARLGHGPRAAVLLQLVAGLDEDEAARVMGVAPAGYRLAIEHAVMEHAAMEHAAMGEAGRASAEQVWRQLREEVQQRIRGLAAPRLSRLARTRETALHGDLSGPASDPPVPGHRVAPRRRRGLLGLLWLLLAGCVLAFAATFWWPFPVPNPFDPGASSSARTPRGGGPVTVEPLPAAGAPARRYDPVTALVTHPDFEQLAGELVDPGLDAVAGELALYSWLVAERVDGPDGLPSVLDGDEAVPVDDGGQAREVETESDDAP